MTPDDINDPKLTRKCTDCGRKQRVVELYIEPDGNLPEKAHIGPCYH